MYLFTLIVRRVLTGVLVLFFASALTFLATQALPGDAAVAILGRDATPAALAALRHQLHLDESLLSQFGNWLQSLLHLDLGRSISNGLLVTGYVGERLGNTIVLLLGAILIGMPICFAIGVLSAYRRGSSLDHGTSSVTLIISSLPEFVTATVLILAFSTGWLHWLPPTSSIPPGESPLSYSSQLVLPVVTLILVVASYMIRMVRASVIDVLETDYVLYARLSGVREGTVVLRHVLPNVLATSMQVLALIAGYLLGGSVIVEYVFNYPGLGTALVDAGHQRDLPVLQAICLVIAAMYVFVNLLADIAGYITNPRIRRSA